MWYTFFLFLCSFNTIVPTPCLDLQASASHTVTYAKKSLKANNFDHQQYYAQRSLEALEHTQAYMAQCSCDAAQDPLLDTQEALERAMAADTWEKGRFYSQRALKFSRKMMGALDLCSAERSE